MAFNIANFTNQGPSAVFSNSQPGVNQLVYTTTDTLAIIDSDPTYFNPIADIARKYDYILVDGNGVHGFYVINAGVIGSSISFFRLW